MKQDESRCEVAVPVAPARVVRALLAVTLLLVVAGTTAGLLLRQEIPFVVDSAARLLLLDAEANLASWFGSSLLLLAALAAAVAALAGAVPRQRGRLLLLASGLLLLSADEAAVVHERLTAVVQLVLRGEDTSDRPYWILVALPLGVAALVLLLPLWRGVPRAARRGYALALAAYLGGAVGVEVVTNVLADPEGVPYLLGVALEEGLECVGAVLALRAGLVLLASTGQPSSSPSPRAHDVV